jgi:hypothetical protein
LRRAKKFVVVAKDKKKGACRSSLFLWRKSPNYNMGRSFGIWKHTPMKGGEDNG